MGRGRELHPQAHRPWCSLHGQRWAQHQRVPVLPLHRQDPVAGWQARRVRPVLRSPGCQATQKRGAMFVIFVVACDFRFCYFGPFFCTNLTVELLRLSSELSFINSTTVPSTLTDKTLTYW